MRMGWAPPGEAGVSRAVAILRADMVRTMKLLGCFQSLIWMVVPERST